MQFKSFACVAALAVGAIAGPVPDPVAEASPEPSSTGAPPPPDVDTSKFTANMSKDPNYDYCGLNLYLPGLCGDKHIRTGKMMTAGQGSDYGHACYFKDGDSWTAADFCGQGSEATWIDKGVVHITIPDKQALKVDFKGVVETSDRRILNDGEAGTVSTFEAEDDD
ncbi:hypothetical protein NUU61_000678 [Penicillium alfredii]|uniref:Uncharacterized protein n=1 Tax=Penicillium alfredii TaxID=1506179 RepID=A0A9W9GAH3_9EURO|nr:uncharacterized protein NUU61_000678 [Penicillium alfredii]KAJ5114919.1 hypothetical protein NUU61_000678 [Penicillium alfredii]